MSSAAFLLLFVTASRLFELMLSARHEKALRAQGAVEVGASHYPAIVALHAAWLAGLWVLGWNAPVSWPWLFFYLILQLARIWTIRSLGERWTTRIIICPDKPLVARGPYRFVRHPNYMIVAAEIAVLPLALGLVTYALVFSLANAVLLVLRITTEDAALRAQRRN